MGALSPWDISHGVPQGISHGISHGIIKPMHGKGFPREYPVGYTVGYFMDCSMEIPLRESLFPWGTPLITTRNHPWGAPWHPQNPMGYTIYYNIKHKTCHAIPLVPWAIPWDTNRESMGHTAGYIIPWDTS